MALQFRRGTAAERAAATDIPAAGEPWFTYDDGQLYVGDGVTAGGVNVASNSNIEDINDVTTIKEDVGSLATYSVASNVATVSLAVNHGYYVGLVVDISNASVAALNGARTITGLAGANGFTFALVTADVSSTAVTGTVTPRVPDGNALIWDSATSQWIDGTPSMSIDDLTDVNTTSTAPTDGQVLTWDNAASNWAPADTVATLSELGGVDITTVAPTAGDLLIYDGTSTNFEPGTLSSNDLSDVDTSTTPTDRDVLVYSSTSSNFEAGTLNIDDLADVDTTTSAPSDGEVLVWNTSSSAWIPGVAAAELQTTSFFYTAPAAPTSTVSSSALAGQNLGSFDECTFANRSSLLIPGPNAVGGDPNLTGITFNGTTGLFQNIPTGRYVLSGSLILYINNPTALLTSPDLLVLLALTDSGSGYYFQDISFGLLPYTSYGSAQAAITAVYSFTATFDDIAANNTFGIFLDQDQGPSYYLNACDVNFVRLGDV